MMNHSLSVNLAPWLKLFRDAADEIAQVQPVMLEHPRQQRRGGRLAMRARDHDGPLAANEKFPSMQLRQRTIAQFFFQHKLRLRVAARNRVAHHHGGRSGLCARFDSA